MHPLLLHMENFGSNRGTRRSPIDRLHHEVTSPSDASDETGER